MAALSRIKEVTLGRIESIICGALTLDHNSKDIPIGIWRTMEDWINKLFDTDVAYDVDVLKSNEGVTIGQFCEAVHKRLSGTTIHPNVVEVEAPTLLTLDVVKSFARAAFMYAASRALNVAQVDGYHEFGPDFDAWWEGHGPDVALKGDAKPES